MPELRHKTITQGRKTVIFGLAWYTVEGEESPRKAGISLAREISHPVDQIVCRKGETPQFGLANGNEGAKTGYIAGAGIVSEIAGAESWLYVMEIESSVWICAGRDGFILPMGDRVYDTAQEAREAFEKLRPETFKKIYLPPSWKSSVAGDEDSDLGDLAGDIQTTDVVSFIEYEAPAWTKLTPISPLGTILKGASALVFIGSLVYGGNYMLGQSQVGRSDTPMSVEDLRARNDAEQLRTRQAQLARFAELDAIRPWHDAAPAGDVYEACMAGIRSVPAAPLGYEVTQVACNGRAVQATVRRTTGFPTWLNEWSEAYPMISVSTTPDGGQGTMTMPLQRIAPRGPEEIVPFQQVSERFVEYAQIEGGGIDLSSPRAAIIPDEPEYVPFYATSTFSVDTLRPGTWAPLLTRTPGVTIERIIYTLNTETYTMEGELYVPNL